MTKKKKLNIQSDILYNSILLLSRNKIFYTKFCLIDTFQNRIHLIFMHMSFIFSKIKQSDKNDIFKLFYQNVFDLTFKKIEINMREIGFSDTTINKNMRSLVKSFYNILIECENYSKKTSSMKDKFFNTYLKQNKLQNVLNNKDLIDYFNKYEAFCFDSNPDSVLKGEFKFNYKEL